MTARIVVLGGGVGGTLVSNLLARKLSRSAAEITVVDATGRHIYQPGWLYVPFGLEKPENLVKRERSLLSRKVRLVVDRVVKIDADARRVVLAEGAPLEYDYLVVAAGARLAPEAVPGYEEAAHNFYNAENALRLRAALYGFGGGTVVVGVADIPYKCPPAPLEFTFMLEDYLKQRGLRDRTKIVYLSPLNRVFTIETVSQMVTPLLEERGVEYRLFFNTESIDPVAKVVRSMEGEEEQYDLLVLVPPHRGAPVVVESGLGDQQGWLPTDRETLQVKGRPEIYALGDATDLPVSKSGSAAHFQAKVVADRIADAVHGKQPAAKYDGHVLCFLETGYGQATQLAFDYEHPPQPPRPSRFYHYEKMLFNRTYWYIVPRGIV